MIKMNNGQARSSRVAAGLIPVCLAGVVFLAGCSSATPEQRVAKARQAYQQHNYHAAEVQLKTVLRKHPDNGAAWALLGHTSLAERQYDDAIHQFNKAKTNGQPAAALALPLGRALVASGKYQQALDALNEPESKSPDHVRALVASLRGDAELGLGDRDKAAKAYDDALSIEPGLPDALQGKARLALLRGDLAGAQAALSKAVSAHPDDVGSLVLLGQVDYRSNRCENAVKRLNHAMKVGAQSMTASQQQSGWALLADCELRTGDPDAAQKNINSLLAANQNNPFGNYLQALMDIRQGDYQNAANHVQAALNVDPNNVRSMTLMAWIRIAQGRPDAAQPFLTRVLARSPDDMAALRLQAGLWMAQNQDDQARDLLENAYQRHPDQPGLHQALSDVLKQLKQKQSGGDQAGAGLNTVSVQLDLARSLARMGSEAAAQTVLSKIKPSTAAEQSEVAAARVQIALAAGHGEQALQQAKALAEQAPQDANAQKLLAQSYVAAGDIAKAADVLAKAHAANPDDASIIRAQARVAVSQGRYADAIADLKPLHEAHPDDTSLTLALAGLYTKAGQADRGIDLLQSAVHNQPQADALNQALARAYLFAGKTDQAVTLINTQLAAHKQDADWLHLLGVAQLIKGNTDAGLKTLERAAEQAPDRPGYALDVAKADLSSGHRDEAIDRLQKLRRQSPDFWPAAGFLALAQAGGGDIDAALKQVSALREAGRDYEANVLDGDVLRAAKRFEQSDAAYEKAYKQHPSRQLAMAMFDVRQAGQLDDPAKPLEQWLNDSPDDAETMLTLAAWDQQHAKADRAADLYRKVLDKHPDSVVALNNLALINAGDHPQRALDYARRAHQQAPANPAIADTLGWIMVGQGDLGSGIPLLETAEKSAGDSSPEIRFHLGAALAKRGRASDQARARSLLSKAISAGLPKDEEASAQRLIKQLGKTPDANGAAE
ncbi:XrtA/PEP-CTERM system TPR-repeat protein PrsT [Salinisphaera hydrothermalis]|uniref:XrtA/PEP-CTERM system TPR-repeat protein PrsT n=1 Tax=Salinisphaera hydrothermalis TaxID=563188 RepID=UPI00333F6334